jgi:hypothetical protein
MPSPLNITNIPAPRVDFIDQRTGLMSREWYRFFLNLFTLTGGGTNPTSLEDLQLGPAFEITPDMFVVDNPSPDAESAIASLTAALADVNQNLQTRPLADPFAVSNTSSADNVNPNAESAIASLTMAVMDLNQTLQTRPLADSNIISNTVVADNISPNSEADTASLTMSVFDIRQTLQSIPQNDYVIFNSALGTPSGGVVTNLTGTASININGTVGATTPTAGAFTTITASNGGTFSTTGTVSSVDVATPNNGSTGGIKLRGNATSGFARIQITDSTASTEWGTLYAASSGLLTYTSTFAALVFSGPINGTIGATTPTTGAFTTVSLTAGSPLSWNADVGLSRSGAATLNLGNGTSGSSTGTLVLTKVNLVGNANITSPSAGIIQVGTGSTTGSGGTLIANAILSPGTGGIGYSTGSGGTQTQLTSRTTGVTLNKTTGAITMFSAAGSATAATFTVTNSTVAATDTVVLSVKSSTNVYLMFVTAVAAGSFNITFQTTGGVATDAPVINFAVIKAVTA